MQGISTAVFKLAYSDLINKLVAFGEDMNQFEEESRLRIYSSIVTLNQFLDKEIQKDALTKNHLKKIKFKDVSVKDSINDVLNDFSSEDEKDESSEKQKIFDDLAKNNFIIPTRMEVESKETPGETPNPNSHYGLTDNEYYKIRNSLRYYEEGKNPIYEPRNYFDYDDTPEEAIKKLKKALLLKKGFFKESLERTQRKKRNGIIRAFLKNHFKVNVDFA